MVLTNSGVFCLYLLTSLNNSCWKVLCKFQKIFLHLLCIVLYPPTIGNGLHVFISSFQNMHSEIFKLELIFSD